MAPKKKYTRRTFVAGIGSALALSAAPRILAQTSPCAVGSYHVQYYRGVNFDVLRQSGCETAPLNKDWGAGSISPLYRTDFASARWSGLFQFAAGEHEFTATADDGIRVYVNGVLIIDEWRDQPPTTYKVRHALSAGTHEVKVEYYERSGVAVCKLLWAPVPSNPNPLPSRQAASTETFLNTIGVNTHFGYLGSVYDNFPQVKALITGLGVRWIRDAAYLSNDANYNNLYYNRHKELADAGIKCSYIVDSRAENLGTLSTQKIAQLQGYMQHSLGQFEGINEPTDAWNPSDVSNYQRALYESTRNNPSTASVEVCGPSILSGWQAIGDLSPYQDYGNIHTYTSGFPKENSGYGADGYGSLERNVRDNRISSGSDPMQATECGYHYAMDSTFGFKPVPESVSAVYIPRLFAFYYTQGIKRALTYELLDEGTSTTNPEDRFGLLRRDYSPKPAYTALQRMISLLNDPGPAFSPASLAYQLQGTLTDIFQLLLQRRNGEFYLLLWQGVSVYDVNTRQHLSVAPRSLTLNLGQSRAVNVYEPNSGTSAIATHTSVSSVPVTVTEKLRIVEIA
jgi:PA14 domain